MLREDVQGEQPPFLGCHLHHCIIPGRISWDSVSCPKLVISQPKGRWDGSSQGAVALRGSFAEWSMPGAAQGGQRAAQSW